MAKVVGLRRASSSVRLGAFLRWGFGFLCRCSIYLPFLDTDTDDAMVIRIFIRCLVLASTFLIPQRVLSFTRLSFTRVHPVLSIHSFHCLPSFLCPSPSPSRNAKRTLTSPCLGLRFELSIGSRRYPTTDRCVTYFGRIRMVRSPSFLSSSFVFRLGAISFRSCSRFFFVFRLEGRFRVFRFLLCSSHVCLISAVAAYTQYPTFAPNAFLHPVPVPLVPEEEVGSGGRLWRRG